MNIKLNESAAIIEEMTPIKDTSSVFQKEDREVFNHGIDKSQENRYKKIAEDVFSVKSKQFIFDCGAIMGSLRYIDSSLKFCLNYHYVNTENFDQFIKSVEEYLSHANSKLTENDKENLRKEYDAKQKSKD